MYYSRIVDAHLSEWAQRKTHKPLLLRGARQIGKSTAVRHLAEQFDVYIEINFEKQPSYKTLFEKDLDVKRIVPLISAISKTSIIAGRTLLFLDEIQDCPQAIMALRYFHEDMPELHVIAAGSLLEFALDELPTFGVGRIHSMYMYPMTFDEFMMANGEQLLLDIRNQADTGNPLDDVVHNRLIEHLRTYMLVGGMPESVSRWVETHDYLQCQEVQDDILTGYEDDFPKYRKKVDPVLLRQTLRSVAVQVAKKFVCAQVPGNYKAAEVKKALDMLTKAGIIIPVTHASANGLPLGDECDQSIRKMLLLDTGLMLRLLNMTLGDVSDLTTHILTSTAADLVNKGSIAEMLAGLEYLHYLSPNLRHEQYYWVRQAKNSVAEIDYVLPLQSQVVPMEVKAGVQGGMKSLWEFMREKKLSHAIRCSLENFSSFDYIDEKADGVVRHVSICPLYAVSQMPRICSQAL
ncbi:MAG: ATP-binding protein [Bacteroidales bacterium]|nr:ATP-binding protein [Candidatus Liminaster caballi]